MISSSIFSRGPAFGLTPPSAHGHSSGTHSTICVVGEYFISSTRPAAKSDIDYLGSPMEQIRNQVNAWLATFGSQTRVETEDATLLVAPTCPVSQEYFDSYESVFRTVMLYRAHLGQWNVDEAGVPSEEQKNAALLGLANLVLALVPAPSPMILEDGTIGAYWRRGKCYASIDFEADGEHSWAGTDGTNFKSGTWKVSSGQIPPALMHELLALDF